MTEERNTQPTNPNNLTSNPTADQMARVLHEANQMAVEDALAGAEAPAALPPVDPETDPTQHILADKMRGMLDSDGRTEISYDGNGDQSGRSLRFTAKKGEQWTIFAFGPRTDGAEGREKYHIYTDTAQSRNATRSPNGISQHRSNSPRYKTDKDGVSFEDRDYVPYTGKQQGPYITDGPTDRKLSTDEEQELVDRAEKARQYSLSLRRKAAHVAQKAMSKVFGGGNS